MRSRSSHTTPTTAQPEPAPTVAADPGKLFVRILDRPAAESLGLRLVAPMFRARWLTASVYALAGAAFALVMAVGFLEASGDDLVSSRRVATLFWTAAHFWPTILAINLVAALHTPSRAAVIVSYFSLLVPGRRRHRWPVRLRCPGAAVAVVDSGWARRDQRWRRS